jgi:hypothetical protein
MPLTLDHPMARLLYRAVIPLGAAGVTVALGKLVITPLVVLNVKPEMLFDPLFDV